MFVKYLLYLSTCILCTQFHPGDALFSPKTTYIRPFGNTGPIPMGYTNKEIYFANDDYVATLNLKRLQIRSKLIKTPYKIMDLVAMDNYVTFIGYFPQEKPHIRVDMIFDNGTIKYNFLLREFRDSPFVFRSLRTKAFPYKDQTVVTFALYDYTLDKKTTAQGMTVWMAYGQSLLYYNLTGYATNPEAEMSELSGIDEGSHYYLFYTGVLAEYELFTSDPVKKYLNGPSTTTPRMSAFCKTDFMNDYKWSEVNVPLICVDGDTSLPEQQRLFTHMIEMVPIESGKIVLGFAGLFSNKNRYGVCIYTLKEIKQVLADSTAVCHQMGTKAHYPDASFAPLFIYPNCFRTSKTLPSEKYLECRFRIAPKYYKLASLVLHKSGGFLKNLYVRPSAPDTETIDLSLFLVDHHYHMRMYAIYNALPDPMVVKPACLEGIYSLYEKKGELTSVTNILWNEHQNWLLVASPKFMQRIRYQELCNTQFFGICSQSPWCRRFNNYCQKKRKNVRKPINACLTNVNELPGNVSATDHYSDVYTCEPTNAACIRSNGLMTTETTDNMCSQSVCMCRALMCNDRSCAMYQTGKVDLLYCTPTKFAQSLQFVGEAKDAATQSRTMVYTLAGSLSAMFFFFIIVFCCVGSENPNPRPGLVDLHGALQSKLSGLSKGKSKASSATSTVGSAVGSSAGSKMASSSRVSSQASSTKASKSQVTSKVASQATSSHTSSSQAG